MLVSLTNIKQKAWMNNFKMLISSLLSKNGLSRFIHYVTCNITISVQNVTISDVQLLSADVPNIRDAAVKLTPVTAGTDSYCPMSQDE